MTYPAKQTSPEPGGSPWRLPQLRHPVAVPLVTVLVVATVGRLLVLSPQLATGETALLEGLSQHRNPVLDVLATVIQVVLSNPGVVVIIAALTGWLAVIRRRPLDATGFLITSLSGWGAVGLVKALVERPRPSLPEGDPLLSVAGVTSFPSGHTGTALAIVLALTLVGANSAQHRRTAWIGCAGVGLVGLSRIYAGAHYPLDVLFALPVAWGGVLVGCALANKLVPALAYGFGWQQAGITVGRSVMGGTVEKDAPPEERRETEADAAASSPKGPGEQAFEREARREDRAA